MEEKFNKKIDKTETCWNWLGRLDNGGYGRFCIGNGKWHKAHRISYTLFKGDIPDGLVVRHLCNNTKCVNPEHLEIGTHKQNTADMYASNRQPNKKGSHNGRNKFIEKDILEIRQWIDFGYTHQQVADSFNTTQGHITNIINKKAWSHI